MKQENVITCCYQACNCEIKGQDRRHAVRISHGWMHQRCYEAHRQKVQDGLAKAIAEGRHPRPTN